MAGMSDENKMAEEWFGDAHAAPAVASAETTMVANAADRAAPIAAEPVAKKPGYFSSEARQARAADKAEAARQKALVRQVRSADKAEAARQKALEIDRDDNSKVLERAGEVRAKSAILHGKVDGLPDGEHHKAQLGRAHDQHLRKRADYQDALDGGDESAIKKARAALHDSLDEMERTAKTVGRHIGEVNKVDARYGAALTQTNAEYSKIQDKAAKALSKQDKVAKALSEGERLSMGERWDGIKDGIRESKVWKGTKTAGKWAGIATVGALAVGLLAGRRDAQARESAQELDAQRNEALAGQMAAMQGPQVGANTLMGMEPTPGAMAARVRGGAEQGALNPPVDRQYQVIS